MRGKTITLEQKMRYLKEVENIHALGKKVRPPAGKSWSDIADARMRHVMGLPLQEKQAEPLRIRRGRMHHEHSPRSARIIERTLKNGILPPAVLQSYRTGEASTRPYRYVPPVERLRYDDNNVQHFVQHLPADLHYPAGHLQGFGFVPRQHEINSHVKLKTGPTEIGVQVPSKDGQAAGSHYH